MSGRKPVVHVIGVNLIAKPFGLLRLRVKPTAASSERCRLRSPYFRNRGCILVPRRCCGRRYRPRTSRLARAAERSALRRRRRAPEGWRSNAMRSTARGHCCDRLSSARSSVSTLATRPAPLTNDRPRCYIRRVMGEDHPQPLFAGSIRFTLPRLDTNSDAFAFRLDARNSVGVHRGQQLR